MVYQAPTVFIQANRKAGTIEKDYVKSWKGLFITFLNPETSFAISLMDIRLQSQ